MLTKTSKNEPIWSYNFVCRQNRSKGNMTEIPHDNAIWYIKFLNVLKSLLNLIKLGIFHFKDYKHVMNWIQSWKVNVSRRGTFIEHCWIYLFKHLYKNAMFFFCLSRYDQNNYFFLMAKGFGPQFSSLQLHTNLKTYVYLFLSIIVCVIFAVCNSLFWINCYDNREVTNSWLIMVIWLFILLWFM